MSKLSVEGIGARILSIRGQRVMLGNDLAELYEVSTKVLMQAVKRNEDRFPEDFMFQLSDVEFENLKSQFVTSSWGGVRKMPYAFTEQGVAMLSSVLRSKRAVQVNIAIMRAFVKIREMVVAHKEIAKRLDAVERKVGSHDKEIKAVFDVIRRMIAEPSKKPVKKKPPIGFK